jgi:hypothetical protein
MRQPFKQHREIRVRLDAVCFCGLDDGIQVGAGDRALDGVAEEPAFAVREAFP